jgi:hypothetical protein
LSSLWITAAASTFFVVVMLLWRLWPLLAGSAKLEDSPEERIVKWNRQLVKLFRRTLKEKLLVGQGGFFTSKADGKVYTMATWSLSPTLLPDVDYVALARPGTEGAPEIEAIARTDALRELLGGHIREHSMWGHLAWIYTWPEEADLDAVVARLTPIEDFRRQHGLLEEHISHES